MCNIRDSLHKLKQRNIYVNLCWIPSHVGIEGNEQADKLAKEATILPCLPKKLPIEDYQTDIKRQVKNSWHNEWNAVPVTNKLRAIKDSVNPWQSSFQTKNRREETILTRLRIGHTNLTHGYLMCTPHDPIPMCNSCNVILSVHHILVECNNFAQQRNLYLRHNNLRDILSETDKFSSFNLNKFLRQCNLYGKI